MIVQLKPVVRNKNREQALVFSFFVAGPAGFVASLRSPTTPGVGSVNLKQVLDLHSPPTASEPANAGTKTQCLTAWRRRALITPVINVQTNTNI